MTPSRVIDRLLGRVTPSGECMVSLYSTGSHGYSQIGWTEDGKTCMSLGHRVAWEAEHGPIPEGMTIDHICRNRRCVNVAHLRLLSNVENARMNGNWVKDSCKRGHAFDHANTYRDPSGHRRCRQCARDRRAIATQEDQP